MNDIDTLNSIKANYGLTGKGVTKKPRDRPRKNKNNIDMNMHGSGFGDFLKSMISLPLLPFKMLTGGGIDELSTMSDAEILKKLEMSGSGKGIDFIKMLYKMFKNMKDGLGSDLYKTDEEIAARTNLAKGSGVTASGKRRYVKKSANGMSAGRKKANGSGILKDVLKMASKIANMSPFTDVVKNTPLAQILDPDQLNDIVVGKVSKMIGVGRPKGKKNNKLNFTKRTDLVKYIMNEKGMSMIDASKFVKAHNLYKKVN